MSHSHIFPLLLPFSDICVEGLFETRIRVEADPPTGFPCIDEEVYVFPIDPACKVDVDIGCVSSDGTECTELETLESSCSIGDTVDTVRLVYVGGTCGDSRNTQGDMFACEDQNGGLTGDTIVVSCTDTGGSQIGNSETLELGETITIERPGGLPTQLVCNLESTSGTILQTVVFDASGESDLTLANQFGGLQLEACADEGGQELDCIDEVTYTYVITNGKLALTLLHLSSFESYFSCSLLLTPTFLFYLPTSSGNN